MNQIPESVRRRLQTQGAAEHPDADLLTAFAEHALTGRERERVLLHLSTCGQCREVVSLAAPESPPAEVAAPAAPSWFRWPVLRWTAVAATVIVVGAAVSVLVEQRKGVDVAVPVSRPAGVEERDTRAADNVSVAPQKHGAVPKGAIVAKQRNERSASGTTDGRMTMQAGARPQQLRDTEASNGAAPSTAPMAIPKPGETQIAEEKAKSLDAAVAKKEMARKDDENLDANAKNASTGLRDKYDSKVAANNVAPAAPPPPPPPPQPQPVQSATESVAVAPLRQAPGAVGGVAAANAPVTLSKTRATTPVRWRVSSNGAVERTIDGNTWEKVFIDPAVTFRAVSSNDGDLWAGGSGGSLFHSADAGRTWSRVKVGMEGMWVSDAITGVNFPTQNTGYVTTASGMTWTTQDAGRTWQPR